MTTHPAINISWFTRAPAEDLLGPRGVMNPFAAESPANGKSKTESTRWMSSSHQILPRQWKWSRATTRRKFKRVERLRARAMGFAWFVRKTAWPFLKWRPVIIISIAPTKPTRRAPIDLNEVVKLGEKVGTENEKAAQPGLVWTDGSRRHYLPRMDEESGMASQFIRRAAHHRNLQHLVRVNSVQWPLSRVGGMCEARRMGVRRLSIGISRNVARRNADATDGHAV